MPKMYFAEFTDLRTGKVFYKFGHTRNNDAMIRMNYITEEYPMFSARILASIWHPSIDYCIKLEESYKEKYPKNFWLKEKISGVTECVVLDNDTKHKIVKQLYTLKRRIKEKYYANRA